MKSAAVAVAALAAAGAHGSVFDDTIDPSDVNADIVLTFDDLTVGQVVNFGDTIAPGVTFGVDNALAGFNQALVIDQGGGDLALRMILQNPSQQTNPSTIAFTLDQVFEGVFATWERASGLNNFDGGFGNPALELYNATDRIYAASTGWDGIVPGQSETSFSAGAYLEPGEVSDATGIVFDISSSGSNSEWIIDDVVIQIPGPSSALVAVLPAAGLIRRRR